MAREVGSRLVRRPDASELAGLRGAGWVLSGRGGCSDARRVLWLFWLLWVLVVELAVIKRGLASVCCAYGPGGPGEPILSRNESRDELFLVGVSWGIGEAEVERLRGLR